MSLYDSPDHGGGHVHEDPAVLTVGCSACVARVSFDQERADVAAAPTRRCTWKATYWTIKLRHVTFSLDLKVPSGWTDERVDEFYIDCTSEAFTNALPAKCSPNYIQNAIETFRLVSVTIGAIVPEPDAVNHPSLFEVTS